VAEQLAALHAEGRTHGPLAAGARVEHDGRYARPVLGPPAGQASPADDVRELGVLLSSLLRANLSGPPDGVPVALWSLVQACLQPDPAARPSAAVLARRLRDVARDLLLGMAPWPSPGSAPVVAGGGAPVPDYVPREEVASEPAGSVRAGRDRRRWLLIGSAAVAVLLAGVGATFAMRGTSSPNGGAEPPSQAPPIEVCLPPDCAAEGTFRAVGEHFVACDQKADGMSAVLLYRRADKPDETAVWASKGQGTCEDHDADIPEGTEITFKVCTGERDQNRIVRCGEPVTGTA
jgi:hypothetical protein